MATLTGKQIGLVIGDNGKWGPGTTANPASKAAIIAWLDTAIAIALAESGGNTTVTHVNSNGSTDYGLWQINSIHSSILSKGDWKDPRANTEMARQVYVGAGNSFKPWAAYNSGAYRKYLGKGYGQAVYDQVLDAKTSQGSNFSWANILVGSGIAIIPGGIPLGTLIAGGDNNPIGGAVSGINNAITAPARLVAGAIKDVLSWLAAGALVIGATLLALLLLALGVWLMLSKSKSVDAAKSAALSAVTKGAL